jgi:hypothetical protein
MSHLKPDFDYIPPVNVENSGNSDTTTPSTLLSKYGLQSSIKEFANGIVDADMSRFYTNTSLYFKTNTNVFDSVGFFKKFSDSYIFTLKKNFSDIPPEKLEKLQEKLDFIEKYIAEILKNSNVENKFLLTLSLGMLEGMLNYENY